jgi:hypothetical protein
MGGSTTQNQWVRCPRGELEQLASRLRGRRRLNAAVAALSAVLATAAIAAGAIQVTTAVNWALAPRHTDGCSGESVVEPAPGAPCSAGAVP